MTARIGHPWTPTVPSTTVTSLPLDATHDELGHAVVDALTLAAAGDLRPGEEDPAGGGRQVIVDADENGLTVTPQAISGESGVWDVPAHPDLRTLPRRASPKHVGQAVWLMADEETDWAG